MQAILLELGLQVTEQLKKHRTSYTLSGVRFDIDRYLDRYQFIPEFLEIEANNIKQIHHYAKMLGYKAEDCLPWSIKELIEHYSKNKK